MIERIEHDDYSAGGFDFFARGDIREIARAVGADSEQLIEEYDAARMPTRASPAAPTWPTAEPTRQPAEPSLAAKAAMAAEALRERTTDLPHARRLLGLAMALLAVAALGGVLLIWGTRGHAGQPAASTRHQLGQAAAHQARSRQRSSAHAARSPGHSPSPTPSGSQSAQTVLEPRTIAAFGPGGTGQGDNPQLARMALAANAATPWQSSWYATSDFGNLQSGTGLLLDMGRIVTVTGARLALGNGPGAHLSLRIGNAPVLADLRTVARARPAGHLVQMSTPAQRGRYVLLWFTKLPPDQAGTFQVSVYGVKVIGHS